MDEIEEEWFVEKRQAFAEEWGYWPDHMTEREIDNYSAEDDDEHFYTVMQMNMNR